MEGIEILIVEDEFIIAEDLAETLRELGYRVAEVANSFEAAITLLEKTTPDIVLLDINLGGKKDGINLGEIIREKYDIPFVFITSYSDKATIERAKQVKPNGYLLKSFDQKSLYSTIEIALVNYSGKNQKIQDEPLLIKDAFFIKNNHLLKKIKYDDIFWIRSEGNYIEIQSDESRFVVRQTLKEISEFLPADKFMKVHKSYIVNINKIDTINSVFILIKNKEIPISRLARQKILNRIHTI